MTKLLDGRVVADALLAEVKRDVEALKLKGILPKLVVVRVGEDPASAIYVRNKVQACGKVGILSEEVLLPVSVSQKELLKKIEELNKEDSVHGMIVQLPLPDSIETPKVIKAINPYKDVDGFHAYNMGKLVLDKDFEDLAACTPKGMIRLLEHYGISVEGKNAAIVGRSNIVGKPMALMLLNRGATVSVCHSQTQDTSWYTQHADLVVVAVGKPGFLKPEMVKKGVVVLDVGINRLKDGSLVGDSDFDGLQGIASAITPVPGGVGPMTVACLLANTVTAAQKSIKV